MIEKHFELWTEIKHCIFRQSPLIIKLSIQQQQQIFLARYFLLSL